MRPGRQRGYRALALRAERPDAQPLTAVSAFVTSGTSRGRRRPRMPRAGFSPSLCSRCMEDVLCLCASFDAIAPVRGAIVFILLFWTIWESRKEDSPVLVDLCETRQRQLHHVAKRFLIPQNGTERQPKEHAKAGFLWEFALFPFNLAKDAPPLFEGLCFYLKIAIYFHLTAFVQVNKQ